MMCSKTDELLEYYFDGELAPEEMDAMRRHVKDCAHCRRQLEQWSSLRETLKDACFEATAPAGFRDGIMQRLQAERQPGRNVPSEISAAASGGYFRLGLNRLASSLKRGRHMAAGIALLLLGSTAFSWFSGGIIKQIAPVALNGGGTSAMVDIRDNLTKETKDPADNTTVAPKPTPGTEHGHAAKEQAGTPGEGGGRQAAGGQESDRVPETGKTEKVETAPRAGDVKTTVPTAFVSVGMNTRSGYIQASAGELNSIAEQLKGIAGRYGGQYSAQQLTGNKLSIRINAPTGNFDAVYAEVKGYLAGTGKILDGSKTGEDLSGAYNEKLLKLQELTAEREQLTASGEVDRERLGTLEQRESNLRNELSYLEQRAQNSSLIITLEQSI